MFALIATLGGLLGGGFVACSKRMALMRARYLAGAKRRFIEASRYMPTQMCLRVFVWYSSIMERINDAKSKKITHLLSIG